MPCLQKAICAGKDIPHPACIVALFLENHRDGVQRRLFTTLFSRAPEGRYSYPQASAGSVIGLDYFKTMGGEPQTELLRCAAGKACGAATHIHDTAIVIDKLRLVPVIEVVGLDVDRITGHDSTGIAAISYYVAVLCRREVRSAGTVVIEVIGIRRRGA